MLRFDVKHTCPVRITLVVGSYLCAPLPLTAAALQAAGIMMLPPPRVPLPAIVTTFCFAGLVSIANGFVLCRIEHLNSKRRRPFVVLTAISALLIGALLGSAVFDGLSLSWFGVMIALTAVVHGVSAACLLYWPIPVAPNTCVSCGYDIVGLTACPECGKDPPA